MVALLEGQTQTAKDAHINNTQINYAQMKMYLICTFVSFSNIFWNVYVSCSTVSQEWRHLTTRKSYPPQCVTVCPVIVWTCPECRPVPWPEEKCFQTV